MNWLKKEAKTRTAFFDLDGVIAKYTGFKGKDIFDEPNPKVIDAMHQLKEQGWKVILYTRRPTNEALIEYLETNNVPYDKIEEDKPLYTVLIDDRALNYHGQDTNQLIQEITSLEKNLEQSYKESRYNFKE